MRIVDGEPNFWIFDALVMITVILFFIRFFTEKVDFLLGFVALCLVGIWVYLYYYLPKVVEPKETDPRLDELISLWRERPLTTEEYQELHDLLDTEEM